LEATVALNMTTDRPNVGATKSTAALVDFVEKLAGDVETQNGRTTAGQVFVVNKVQEEVETKNAVISFGHSPTHSGNLKQCQVFGRAPEISNSNCINVGNFNVPKDGAKVDGTTQMLAEKDWTMVSTKKTISNKNMQQFVNDIAEHKVVAEQHENCSPRPAPIFGNIGFISPAKSVESSATNNTTGEQLEGQQIHFQLHQSLMGNTGTVPDANTIPATRDDCAMVGTQ
ncbi:hypothetical protein A4A49_61967, partial [Nicotiana attenuata]